MTSPESRPAPPPDPFTRNLLQQGIALQRGSRLDEAEACFRAVLERSPRQPDALRLLGLLALGRGDAREAQSLISLALRERPADATAWQDLGKARMRAGDAAGAEKALREALRLKPRDAAAAATLGFVLQQAQRHQDAVAAYRLALQHGPTHPGLLGNLAHALYAVDRTAEAREVLDRALAAAPAALELLELSAVVDLAVDRPRAASATLDRLLAARPGQASAWTLLGQARRAEGDAEGSLAAHQRAVELAGDDAATWNHLGVAHQQLGDAAAASKAYTRALELDPDHAGAAANLALLAERGNRLELAGQRVRAGLARHPEDALLNLVAAQVERRTGALHEAESRLRRMLGGTLEPRRRQSMCFELGRVLDAGARHDEAMRAFGEGNRLAREVWQLAHPGGNRYRAQLQSLRDYFQGDAPSTWGPAPTPAPLQPSPVFLVGFPRSGTTLLDQMLDAHPDIRVVEEQPAADAIERVFGESPAGYPEGLADPSAALIEAARRAWLDAVRRHVGDHPGVIVDKMPLNLAKAALIARVFPEARFVLALRHPFDACLSCYMQEFGANHAMANFHTLADTASLYDLAMSLWQRYRELFGLLVHEQRYESLVEAPEAQARALLDFVGVPWNQIVLDTAGHARRRARINTPSYHQVSRAIHGEARERWRRYREHLFPDFEPLRPHAARLGYSTS